ncbi:MAG: dockerin type I domain-containing protein [Acutalibacteraceae bacterium]|nr:dockerin type I domain-containing protein [Acutalibacteraceae bacterium]
MIKKIAALFLTLLFLISFIPVVIAQEPEVSVNFSLKEATVGETFTITLDVKGSGITKVTAQLDINSYINYNTGNMGFDTDTMRYTVSFNPSKEPLVIECVAVRKGMAQMIFKDIKIVYADGSVNYEDTGDEVKIRPQYTPIYTKEQLSDIRNNLSGDFILMNDIVFEESDFEEGGAFYFEGFGWRPIGAVVSDCFSGSFNGNGYAVRGLKMNKAYYNFGGLFGVSRGEIENLRVIDAVIDGEYGINTKITSDSDGSSKDVDYNDKDVWTDPDMSEESLDKYDRNGVSSATVGIICGYNLGRVTESFASGTVKGNTYVGGITGRNTGSITECAVDVVAESKLMCGGISAVTGSSSVIADCAVQGSVSGSVAGGIVGSVKGEVSRVYAVNTVNGATVGGDFGEGSAKGSEVYAVSPEEASQLRFDSDNWNYEKVIPYPSALADLIEEKPSSVFGDVNGDSVVNTADLAQLKLYLAGSKIGQLSESADLNGDGEVTSADLAVLKIKLANG